MADRRAPRSRTRNVPWNSSDPSNWTVEKLKTELERMNIFIPASLGKNVLKKIYVENIARRDINNSGPNNIQTEDNVHGNQNTPNQVSHSSSTSNTPAAGSSDDLTNAARPNRSTAVTEAGTARNDTSGSSTSNMAAPIPMNINNPIVTGMLNSMQSMQQTMFGMQQSVLKLASDRNTADGNEGNSLSTAYAAMRSPGRGAGNVEQLTNVAVNNTQNGGYRFPISEFGVPSECVPHLDIVQDNIKKKIWEGKDVNLASLLIPKFDNEKNTHESGHQTINIKLNDQEDVRLHKSLTISEFITAFGKYKRVMCVKFPERRVELDRYEANIVDVSNVYGSKFFEYHCQFSARAAAALRDHNIKVDWAIKDNTLLTMVAGNARMNACNLCNSTMHPSAFCPQLATSKNTFSNMSNVNKNNLKVIDRYGRKRIMFNDKEVCNNFNERSCYRPSCQYAHVCSVCHASTHGANSCTRKKTFKPLESSNQ